MQSELYRTSITVVQLVMLIFASSGVMAHVIIIPLLLRAASRDAWISVLASGGALLLGTLVISLINRLSRQAHIGDWIRSKCHPALWHVVLILCLIQLFMMGAITLRDTCTWATVMYMPQTPLVWTVALLAIGCYFAAKSGLSTIAISNGILLPLVIALGIFVSIGNIPNKNYSYLRPVFEHGFTPVLHGMFVASAAFSEVILIIFIQPLVTGKIRWYVLLIIGGGIIGLTVGPLIGAIAEFGPYEAARMRYTPYEEWRLLTFKHYFEHVDFLSIYQWLAGAYIRISLAMFLIPHMLQVQSSKLRNWILRMMLIGLFVGALYPISDEQFSRFISDVYLPFYLFSTVCIVVLLLFTLAIPHRTRSTS